MSDRTETGSTAEQNKEWGFASIDEGSELYTKISFAVGELSRDSLEETAANAGVSFDKWTSSDDLRALVLDAARDAGGLEVSLCEEEGGTVSTYGFEMDELKCFVRVTGEATDADDEGLPGIYAVDVKLARAVDPRKLGEEDLSAIAGAVLDEFHDNQGIEVLDDFNISAHLPNGAEIIEGDTPSESDIVSSADYGGQIESEDNSEETADQEVQR